MIFSSIPRAFQLRLGRVVGAALVLLTWMSYRSDTATVLGRWSAPAAMAIGLMAALTFVLAAVALRRRGRAWSEMDAGAILDASLLLLGVAYAWSAWDDPRQILRLADLNLLGSHAPGPALLEWVAVLLLLLAAGTRVMRLPARFLGLAVVVLSVSAGLLLGEGLTRAVTLAAPQPKGWDLFSTKAWRRTNAKLNSLGFRDTEHNRAEADSPRKLLVIGDSFAFGWGISDPRERFGERLAALLQGRTGGEWESLNASAPGAHTLRHTEYLEQMLPYHPDVVLLLYVFNDIDYLEDRLPSANQPNAGKPGRLHPASILFHNSYLFQEAYIRWRAMTYAKSNSPVASFGELGEGYPYSHDDLLAEHLTDLERFVEISRDAGALTAIVPIDLDLSLGGPHLARYQRFVEKSTARGLPVWDVSNQLRAQERDALILNRFDPHPNALAYSITADGVIERLSDQWRQATASKPSEVPGL